MTNTVYFTICARNYLGYAKTLAASLSAAMPTARFVVFLVDTPMPSDTETLEIVPAETLGIEGFEDMSFAYDVMEFSTAIKPSCFKYVFEFMNASRALYLDPDIFVTAPLREVSDAFDAGAAAVVTPHITRPLPEDGCKPTNSDLLAAGTYNLGFLALADTNETRLFLDWWAAKCRWDCIVAFDKGLFVDQKFAEFLPSFVGPCTVLRHPGYNAAYWNLCQRDIRVDDDQWTADGQPLVFFHFSGVSLDRPDQLSSHQDRLCLDDLDAVRSLLDRYLSSLKGAGQARFAQLPYAYGSFPSGERVPKPVRRYFRAQRLLGQPIATFSPQKAVLNAPVPGSDPRLTRFMAETLALRPDLTDVFDTLTKPGRIGFERWFHEHAVAEGLATVDYVPRIGMSLAHVKLRLRRWLRRLLVG